ncbi:MAG: hypothetical protein ACE5DI_04475 [Candidatus Micrarchaeia archaeon]
MTKPFFVVAACLLLTLASTPSALGSLSESKSLLTLEKTSTPIRSILNFCFPYSYDETLHTPAITSENEEFKNSIGLAQKAKEELAAARSSLQPYKLTGFTVEKGVTLARLVGLAKNVEKIVNPATHVVAIAGALYLTYELYSCNQHAHSSLEKSIQSAQDGLDSLDVVLSEFDLAYGDADLSGLAGDVKNTLNEISSNLEKKSSKGGSLGSLIVKASGNLDKISARMRNDFYYQPLEVSPTVFLLISSETSVLSKQLELAAKAKNALQDLKRTQSILEEENHELELETHALAQWLEKQEVAKIPKDASFQAQEAVFVSTAKSGSYLQRTMFVKEEFQRAQNSIEESNWLKKRKERGFLAKSVQELLQARKAFEESKVLAEKVKQDSLTLEEQLEKKVEELLHELDELVENLSKEDAVQATLLSMKIESARKSKQYQSVGKRVEHLWKKADELQRLSKAARARQVNAEVVRMLRAKIENAKKLVRRAEKDDVDVELEKSLLQEVEKALENFEALDKNAALSLQEFDEKMDAIEEGILKKALTQYADLEGKWKAVKSLKNFLQKNELQELNSFNHLFASRSPNVKQGLGNLKNLQEFLQKTLSALEFDAKNIVEKHLEKRLQVTIESQNAKLDQEAKVTATIKVKNALEVGYDGLVELKLPFEIPQRFIQTNGNAQVIKTLENALLVIEEVGQGQEYFAKIEYEKVLASKTSQFEQTVFENDFEKNKKIFLEFEGTFEENLWASPPRVLIEKSVWGKAEFFVSATTRTEYFQEQVENTSILRILAKIRRGKNSVEITVRTKKDAPKQNASLYAVKNAKNPVTSSSSDSKPNTPNTIVPAHVEMQFESAKKKLETLKKIAVEQEDEQLKQTALQVEEDLKKAGVLLEEGREKDAKRLASKTEQLASKAMGQQALLQVKSVEEECKKNPSACNSTIKLKTTNAKNAANIKNFEKSFQESSSAKKLLENAVRQHEKTREEKLNALVELQELEKNARQAILEFENAFSGQARATSTASKLKGERLKKEIENALKQTVQLQENAVSTSKTKKQRFEETALQQINALKKELQKKTLELKNVTNALKEKAEEELRLASKVEKQQETPERSHKLQQAREQIQQGNYLTGYTIAKDLNKELLKQTPEKKQEKNDSYLYGAIGLGTILLLAFIFYKHQKTQEDDEDTLLT